MDDFHAREVVVLTASAPRGRAELHKWLRARGFVSIDDFYVLRRKDKSKPWQSDVIASIDICLNGHGVYETEEDISEGGASSWNELRIEYLLATLPVGLISDLLVVVDSLVKEYNLVIKYYNDIVDCEELKNQMNLIADSLAETVGEPGSEILAIQIEQNYRR